LKILFLDDNSTRISAFKLAVSSTTTNCKLDVATTAEEAVTFLRTTIYDLVFLDHDLGGEEFVDSSVLNTGYTVARFISQYSIPIKLGIILHSCNPVGAQNQMNILCAATCDVLIDPFPSMMDKIDLYLNTKKAN